ncbi:MAG: ATP-binding protein [Bacteroidales bacterium]|nr:ATP-binding protein [Bacteroidales bacterium]MDD4670342.1 ATP-binding protein [Bacteroidales bacterium]
MMEIKRDLYLNKLIERMNNGMIKVVTGVRRSGKSYLLLNIFSDYLRSQGTADDHILQVELDDRKNKALRDPDAFCDWVDSKIQDGRMYYLMIDEIQMLDEFVDVLNSMLHIRNVDTYVTGSNARFLSKDIATEFRGRGDEIDIYPLSFAEFMSVYDGSEEKGIQEYLMYGGMPQVVTMVSSEAKAAYLDTLYVKTYRSDIMDRYSIRNPEEFDELVNILASGIGGLTNPKTIADTFNSVKNVKIHRDTIATYIEYLEDAFVISKAQRYDIKGRRYIGTPMKYYFADCGLRNAKLGFRQVEYTHLMENLIYNELKIRGFKVDVGSVTVIRQNENNNNYRAHLEVDFVCNNASTRYYVQSAYKLPDQEKIQQEKQSLVNLKDSFKKVIVVFDPIAPWHDEDGILYISLFDFLLKPNSLDM